MTGRKRSDGIKTGVESLPRDEPGGNLLTAHGTWEPAPRYGLAVHWAESPPAGRSEILKWQKPRGAE
jgi:hypothetical protein